MLSNITRRLQSSLRTICSVYGAIVAVLVAIFIVAIWRKCNCNSAWSLFENFSANHVGDADNNRQQTAQFLHFWANWCPACMKTNSTWDAFKKQYDGKTLSDATDSSVSWKLSFIEYDCSTEENPEVVKAMETYNVNEFPTVYLVKGQNDAILFDANITTNNLQQFMQSEFKLT